MIAVKCPHCQAAIRCDDRYAGRAVLCPTCKKQIQMPAVAQPLPAQRAPSYSPPPLPEAEPALQDDDGLSFLNGGSSSSSSRSSSSYSKPRPYLPKKKKKTDPTLYIVGGVVVLIAAVGIGLFASGMFQPPPSSRNQPSSSKETKTATQRDAGEDTPDGARKVLCMMLDSWVLGEDDGAFKKEHPDVALLPSDVAVRANRLLRYEINASKTEKRISSLRADTTGQERNHYIFAVTLSFVTDGGDEIKKPEKYSLVLFEGQWYGAH